MYKRAFIKLVAHWIIYFIELFNITMTVRSISYIRDLHLFIVFVVILIISLHMEGTIFERVAIATFSLFAVIVYVQRVVGDAGIRDIYANSVYTAAMYTTSFTIIRIALLCMYTTIPTLFDKMYSNKNDNIIYNIIPDVRLIAGITDEKESNSK